MNTRRPMFSDNLPGTIEEVFADFKGRRAGLVKAFTTDFKTFFQHCDPGRDNLSLYGFPDETWEVNEPDELVPPEAPEPTLGINFARDEIGTDEWLALVAIHSDVWLLALTFSLGANIGLNKAERMRLFNMINKLPTLVEVVTGAAANPNPQQKGKSAASKGRRAKSKSKGRGGTSKQKQKDESDEDKEGESTCGACGREYVEDEFWIFCDICEKWYHGACVGINPAAAEHIKKFRCPACCR